MSKTQNNFSEPVGFKGRPGKWEVGYGEQSLNFGVFLESSFIEEGAIPPAAFVRKEHPICFVSPAEFVNDIDRANAAFIAGSKRIACAAQALLSVLDDYRQPSLDQVVELRLALEAAGL